MWTAAALVKVGGDTGLAGGDVSFAYAFQSFASLINRHHHAGLFFPAKELKALRRTAVEALMVKVLHCNTTVGASMRQNSSASFFFNTHIATQGWWRTTC